MERLEQELAAVRNELDGVRRERDELERGLLEALDELARLRRAAAPSTSENADPRQGRGGPSGLTASAPAPSPSTRAAQATPTTPAPSPSTRAAQATPTTPAPSPGMRAAQAIHTDPTSVTPTPSIRLPAPHAAAELSRLIVSTRPPVLEQADIVHPAGSERRRGERRECEFDVEFLGDSHFITGITQDLSEGGVFVATYESLPIGTPVSLAFELPGGHRIEARGEVRWRRAEREESGTRPGLGIAFTELTPEALAKISEFCGSLQVRYYEF